MEIITYFKVNISFIWTTRQAKMVMKTIGTDQHMTLSLDSIILKLPERPSVKLSHRMGIYRVTTK